MHFQQEMQTFQRNTRSKSLKERYFKRFNNAFIDIISTANIISNCMGVTLTLLR